MSPKPALELALEDLTTTELERTTGATFRQLDYWARLGLVKPRTRAGGSGSGFGRRWPFREAEVAAQIARLLEAGLELAIAAGIARDLVEHGVAEHTLAPGVVLTVTP